MFGTYKKQHLSGCTIAKHSCNMNINEIAVLVFDCGSEEQCISKLSDIEHRT
jgi:hypothetical protein